jgi:hypothetical protein
MKNKKGKVFLMVGGNKKKEIELELKYWLSMPIKKRFEVMFKKNEFILKLMERYGRTNRRTFKVVQRK